MQTIDIDFEVFKELTMRRKSEEVTYNDVIRELLQLPPIKIISKSADQSWVTKGVLFPNGTQFRATYKGETFLAKIENGKFYHNNQRFASLSAAACAITSNSVNGWKFWDCKFPGTDKWKPAIELMRK